MSERSRFDVFLSYHSPDLEWAKKLAQRLRDDGFRPFLDETEIAPGDPWPASLENGLKSSGCCAVLVGPEGLGPDQETEVISAIEEHRNNPSFRVIPILLPGATATPMLLKRFSRLNFGKASRVDAEYHRLISWISARAATVELILKAPARLSPRSWSQKRWIYLVTRLFLLILLMAGFGYGYIVYMNNGFSGDESRIKESIEPVTEAKGLKATTEEPMEGTPTPTVTTREAVGRPAGSLFVNVNPWGKITEVIRIGGGQVILGPERFTPLLISDLSPGEYRLRIENPGFGAPIIREVSVRAGETASAGWAFGLVDVERYLVEQRLEDAP